MKYIELSEQTRNIFPQTPTGGLWYEKIGEGFYQNLNSCPTSSLSFIYLSNTMVNLGDKERFDKEQIGVKEPFTSYIRIRNFWREGTILGSPKSSLSPISTVLKVS